MSPAAGGAAPTQPAAPAPAAIGAPPPQPPSQENLRDPVPQTEGADPGNAAARKTAWNVPPPPPPSAAPVGGGIMGGRESWPALADSAAVRGWPKSASSDSLRSLSDGSAPSAPEDLVVSSEPSHLVSTPISGAPSPSPPSTSPPPSATATAPSPQNGSTSQPDLVWDGGSKGGNNGGGSGGKGSTRGRSSGNNSSDGNSSSGGDGNWNDLGIHSVSNLNSNVHSGGSNLNSGIRGIGGSGIDSSRRVHGSNNWNSSGRGGGGSNNSNNNNGSGDWSNRNNGGSGGGHWNNNGRNGSGISNGFGGRGGRNRRDHDRGANFSPRNYSRALPVQQQQPGFYQPGPFQRPPPPPPAAHFMMPQPFVPYVPPFAYPADVQGYPFYVTPVEQHFQNMLSFQQPMQPLGPQQDQLSLQNDIQHQIEHYFSSNNLCHDIFLRRHMDDQGWVPIDFIAGFPMLTRFTMMGVDTNYILGSLRGSELLEVQGNNIRRRNDWPTWLMPRDPTPSN